MSLTSNGRISVDHTYQSVGYIKVRLYDFSINSSKIKSEHSYFIKKHIIPLFATARTCWIEGHASRAGGQAHNLALSRRRAEAVQRFIVGHAVDSTIITSHSLGETRTIGAKQQDAIDRAVVITIRPKAVKSPPAPPKPPPGPPMSRRFKMRIISELGFMFLTYMVIEVWDTTNNVAALYQYAALAIALSARTGGSTPGPWNDFTTDKPASANSFGVYAEWWSAGALDKDINYMVLRTPHGSFRTIPTFIPVGTGFTYGGGIGTAGGWLKLKPWTSAPDGLYPRTNPK